MKRGVPPTDLKARTGELTPPGTTARARLNNDSEAGAPDGYESITASLSRYLLRCPAGRGLYKAYGEFNQWVDNTIQVRLTKP